MVAPRPAGSVAPCGRRRPLSVHQVDFVPSLEARLWDRICDQYVSDAVQVIADARPYRHLFPLPGPADFDRYH